MNPRQASAAWQRAIAKAHDGPMAFITGLAVALEHPEYASLLFQGMIQESYQDDGIEATQEALDRARADFAAIVEGIPIDTAEQSSD